MRLGFFRNRDGAAAVEFGLVAPLVVAVLVGIVTYGGTIMAYSRMRQAISSGAQYALSVADDPATVEDVVDAAWHPKPTGGTVAVTQMCYCADAPGTVTDCSVNCADGDYPQMFTRIQATQPYTRLGGDTVTLTANQQIRTR
jgi:Flp pilus assembly protein TadG